MKSESDIKMQLKCMIERRLNLRFKKMLSKNPHNCVNAREYDIVFNNDKKYNKVLCSLNMNRGEIFVCDVAFCNKCGYYKLKNTKGEVENNFKNEISNPELCAQTEPKIAMLLWVLQDTKTTENIKLNIWGIIKKWLNPSGYA